MPAWLQVTPSSNYKRATDQHGDKLSESTQRTFWLLSEVGALVGVVGCGEDRKLPRGAAAGGASFTYGNTLKSSLPEKWSCGTIRPHCVLFAGPDSPREQSEEPAGTATDRSHTGPQPFASACASRLGLLKSAANIT
jgi:hypothetical protein